MPRRSSRAAASRRSSARPRGSAARRQLVVKAFDRGDLVRLDIGDLLELAKALGDQQLSQRLVDVQLLLEQGRALDEFLLALLARIGLGHDVDRRRRELRGETHILAAAADGERQLVVRHHHFDAALFLVDDDAADGRRLQRVDDEGRKVGRPGDDVDLLALHLLHHGLHAAALHADAGADRVDRAVVADHADLGAAARVAGSGLDLDDAVVNFGHFLREQLLHEVRVRAAEEDLRPARLARDVEDDRAGAVADAQHFARDLLVAADHALGAAEVDDHVAELDALDDAGDDLADAVLELLMLALALGVAHLLEDDLLGGLGGDAAELDRRQRIDDVVADRGAGLELLASSRLTVLK
jgi:hypothetical protein